MDDLMPYSAMKESSVPWLGEVPEHWDVVRLKGCAANIIEQTNEREKDEIYVALEHVESWTGRLREAGPNVSFDSQVKRFRVDDVLFGKLRPYLAKVTRPFRKGVCVGEFLVLRPRDDDLLPGYLEQLIRSKPIIDAINASTFGAKMPRADWQFIGGMEQPLPPLPEQTAIVRFLDYVDRRVRRYIRAKQKLIELLKEQKQAIIHRAVTRGLNPDVSLKPSGVEWLGDVPEHWEMVRLGKMGRLSKGNGGTKADEVLDGVACIRYGDLYMHHKFFIEASRSFVTPECATSYTSILHGDVLFAGSGETIEEIGKSAVNLIESEACCGGDVIIFRPFRDVVPRFMGYATDCSQAVHQKACMGRGVTVMHIYGDQLKYMWIALPPLPEQAAIVKHLDKATAAIDAATDRARQEIDLLREYRTRLIADVVTGKLDVREVATNLPEESEEQKELDVHDEFEDNNKTMADDLDAIPEEAEA